MSNRHHDHQPVGSAFKRPLSFWGHVIEYKIDSYERCFSSFAPQVTDARWLRISNSLFIISHPFIYSLIIRVCLTQKETVLGINYDIYFPSGEDSRYHRLIIIH